MTAGKCASWLGAPTPAADRRSPDHRAARLSQEGFCVFMDQFSEQDGNGVAADCWYEMTFRSTGEL